MAIGFVGGGTVATGTGSCTPSYPTSPTAGNLLVLVVGSKYPNNAPAQPTGFSTPTNNQFTGGAGASGVDSGQTTATVFYRIADGTETGTITVSISSGNSITARIYELSHSASASGAGWDVLGGGGSDTSAGTNWAISSLMTDLRAGDYVVSAAVPNGNTYTYTGPAITATGLTMGTETLRQDQGSAQGDDMKLVSSTHAVTSGTVTSGTVSFALTASGTTGSEPAGATIWLRAREVFTGTATVVGPSLSNKITGSGQLVFSASGTVPGKTGVAGPGSGQLTFSAAGTVPGKTGVAGPGSGQLVFSAAGTVPGPVPAAGPGTGTLTFQGSATVPGKTGVAGPGTGQLEFRATGSAAGPTPSAGPGSGQLVFQGAATVPGPTPSIVGVGLLPDTFTGTGVVPGPTPSIAGAGTTQQAFFGTATVPGPTPSAGPGTGQLVFQGAAVVVGPTPSISGSDSPLVLCVADLAGSYDAVVDLDGAAEATSSLDGAAEAVSDLTGSTC